MVNSIQLTRILTIEILMKKAKYYCGSKKKGKRKTVKLIATTTTVEPGNETPTLDGAISLQMKEHKITKN